MPPKKKEQQKMSLGDFLNDTGYGGGSWADEVEETYVSGTQQLPPARDSARSGGNMSSWQDRGYSVRESVPTKIPDRPPFTAHLGNLSYDATSESVTAFFEGCDVVSVRIIEDRELQRPKGFGYVEFGNVEGLKKALNLNEESFEGRMIKIKVADPPRGGDGRDGRGESTRDLSDWTRRGPLPDLGPSRGGPRSDFGERRPRDPASEGRAPREMNWERRGPLSPTAPQESGSRESSRARGPQEGLGERSESYRGNRRDPATWGEGNGRPPRQYNERPERPERPERTATAAEKDFQWRSSMRPDAANAPAAEAPASPGAAAPAQPAGRPRLNLQKRTVSETADSSASAAADSKASPFGAARPIDTAAREKEIEDKRLQTIQEKREADEKAKEEKRAAREAAAAKAEAEAKEAAEAAEAKAEAETEAKPEGEAKAEGEAQNGAAGEKTPVQTQDQPKEAPKSRATESGNWRSEPRTPRGPPNRGDRGGRGGAARGPRNENRAPRSNGQQAAAAAAAAPVAEGDAPAPAAPAPAPTVDNDGWTTVAVGKKGRTGRV